MASFEEVARRASSASAASSAPTSGGWSANRATSPAPTMDMGASAPEPQGDGYVSIFDRLWNDDFWNNIWTDDFSAVPVVGPVASFTASTLDRGYKRVNQGISWGISAMPGGMDTMSLDQAYDVSPAQAALTNVVEARKQGGVGGWAAHAGFLGDAFAAGLEKLDPTNPLFANENFKVTNEAQRKEAFESGGVLQYTSGAMDLTSQFFLDPLVIVGKGLKVARFGSKMLGTSGLTNRSLASAKMVEKVGDEADTALSFIDNGVQGTDNMIGTIADEVVRGDFVSLRELPQFQNESRDILASIGALIDDKRDAVVFLAAAAGNQKYIRMLHQNHLSAYDALRRAKGSDVYEANAFARKPGEWQPALLPDTLEADINAQSLLADLARRNEALAKAIGEIDDGTQLIKQFGMIDNPLAVQGARIAAAWRATGRRGAARPDRATTSWNTADAAAAKQYGVDLAPEEIQRLDRVAAQGTAPAAFETVFQASGALRRVAVWDWLGGFHASGMVAVRGPNIGKSSDEIDAALTDSKALRSDAAFRNAVLNDYGRAVSEGMDRFEAVKMVERRAAAFLAAKYGVSDEAWREVYKRIDKSRYEAVQQLKSRAFGVDEDGTIIRATPQLRAQLETSMPMLDMDVLEQSMKIAAKGDTQNWRRADKLWAASEMGKNTLDQVQSLWKASVLLRLGYTQRNVLEGWLRTAAVLGTIPALKHPARSLKNFNYNMTRVTAKRLGRKWQKQEDLIGKDIAALRAQMDADGISDMQRSLLQTELDAKFVELDALVAKRLDLQSRKYIGDREGEAFAGELGDLYRSEAFGYQTVDNFLESEWMRRRNMRMAENSWSLVSPDSQQYWGELATAVRQFRNDDIAMRVLAGENANDIIAWLNSSAGRSYRNSMKLSHKAVPEHVLNVESMVMRYLPTQEARLEASSRLLQASDLSRLLGGLAKKKRPRKPDPAKYMDEATGEIDAKAFNAAMRRYNKKQADYSAEVGLSPIHGREVSQVIPDLKVMDLAQKGINKLFRGLGTRPEGALVRAPFYNEVWTREFNRLQELARAQGVDLKPEVLERINRLSHRTAMRKTNETLYTIERLSNPAAMMRFIAPFFPAWENSARVWFKIIMDDPSVLGRAAVLWSIPNQLGMVVDADGNKVGRESFSFLSGAQDRYIILPEGINETLMKFNGGVPVKIPQGALNVVTPGETPYLPGLGPLVAISAGTVLKSRPDVQEWIRTTFPVVWQQIAPLGSVQEPIDAAPAWMRKLYTVLSGESNNDYLQTVDAMMATAMVDWALSDYDPDMKPSYDDIIAKSRSFYLFSIGASLSLPFATTRMSKYQDQIDKWRELQADNTLTYREKVDRFLAKMGSDAYLPLVASTSEYAAGSISPDMNSWRLLTDNADLIREVAALDPEAVGVLAATAPRGEFDIGVYGALEDMKIPGTNDSYRARKTPQEMQNSITMQRAWREYNLAKELRDETMRKAGITSLQSAAAAGIKQAWDQFTDVYMVGKYGDLWTTTFQSWKDKTPIYLEAIGKALNSADFMEKNGNSPLWSGVRKYMEARQTAQRAVASGQITATNANEALQAWTNSWKGTNAQFMDFYDNYLENDNVSLAVANL